MKKTKSGVRILFIGFHHGVNDPRIFHREMKALRKYSNDVSIYCLSRAGLSDLSLSLNGKKESGLLETHAVAAKMGTSFLYGTLRRILPRLLLDFLAEIYDGAKTFFAEGFAILKSVVLLVQLDLDFIQVSEIRELHWGVLLRFLTGARLIYDVLEDFFNQVYEYSGKTNFAWMKAHVTEWVERFFLLFVHAVFCADDYIYEKYSRLMGPGKNVFILRNFPLILDFPRVSKYEYKNTLHLVYVGSVNLYRGVIECANYVAEFNRRFDGQKHLTFTVYSRSHPIVYDLVQKGLVRHVLNMDYADLLFEIVKYDVGVGLLLPLLKYERNLPVKNFDYMAVGLPVVTSNFGNLVRYASESGGALCINPLDYTEFETAITRLFDPLERKRLGENGIQYTRDFASFEKDAESYVRTILGHS